MERTNGARARWRQATHATVRVALSIVWGVKENSSQPLADERLSKKSLVLLGILRGMKDDLSQLRPSLGLFAVRKARSTRFTAFRHVKIVRSTCGKFKSMMAMPAFSFAVMVKILGS